MFKSQLFQIKIPIGQRNTLPSNMDQKHSQHLIHLGTYGENLAQTYLENDGYVIEAHNWRGHRGELDLIVRKNRILVIVEVRTTSTSWLERPAEAIPLSKQKQVARCTDEYMMQRGHVSASEIDHIRFDVIGLFIPKGSVDLMSKPKLEHISTHKIVIDHVENAYTALWAF